MTLAQRLRAVRGTKSQAAFAAEFGVHKNSIGAYEREETMPDSAFVLNVCRRNRVNPTWLLTGEGPREWEEVSFPVDTPSMPAGEGDGPRVPSRIPVLGLAACGIAGWYNSAPLALSVSLPGHYAGKGRVLAVIAIGLSMRPDGIRNGYLVFCDAGLAPEKDDAVFIEKRDGSASIKRFVNRDESWVYVQGWLDPDENGQQRPYTDQLAPESIKTLAPVVFVQRRA